MAANLELNDIQGTVFRDRPSPYFGAYLIYRVDDAAGGRAVLKKLIPHVADATDWRHPKDPSSINITFTAEGLRRLGVQLAELEHFPRCFVEGMAARKVYLGDVEDSDPTNWDLPHGKSGFHMGLSIVARSEFARDMKLNLVDRAVGGSMQLRMIARLDVGSPHNLRDHFGFVNVACRPFVEGEGGQPSPGQGQPMKAGEFLLGYENELGELAKGGGPQELWRNGTFIAIRKLRQNVASFRRFLREASTEAFGQELLAAKMMGRWRSGCPLALSPDRDDVAIAHDPARNNSFGYGDDQLGLRTPAGSHIRRSNPRDALGGSLVDVRLHRIIRRGSCYGPALSERALHDDGADRGVVFAAINADPERQFEFIQAQWINDGNAFGEGSRSDPICGRRDIADDFTYPRRPARRRLRRLPDFTVVRGGEHLFLPGLGGLRWLSGLTGGITH